MRIRRAGRPGAFTGLAPKGSPQFFQHAIDEIVDLICGLRRRTPGQPREKLDKLNPVHGFKISRSRASPSSCAPFVNRKNAVISPEILGLRPMNFFCKRGD
jgi:hypothetical protein